MVIENPLAVPFATPSSLPYGLPPFDRISDAAYRPAFLTGMAAQRAEIESIARAPPSFEDTLVALERSGRLLERVSSVFFNLTSSNASEAMLQLEIEIAPLLAAHRDSIYLDPQLFARIDSLHAARDRLGLSGESRQLLERYHITFVRAGAHLSDADKATLSELNQSLSVLRTQFRQHVLQATREGAVVIEQAALLEGLSAEQMGAAAEAARARQLPGKWVIALQNTTTQPVLAQLKNRALRRQIYEASVGRNNGGPNDNTAIIAQLVRLRAERARLLGYPNHAAYVLADENAGTPAAVSQVLQQIGAAALAQSRREAAQLQRCIDAEASAAQRDSFELQAWDWQYYAERERQARYHFDSACLRPYFSLEQVLQQGVFYTAHELYGLSFWPRADLPVYHPDVRVFEVVDAQGVPLALFLADYYARENKQGGAWMSNFVTQSRLLGQKPVVINCLNIPPPAPGQPALLSFEEVTTLYHEFGHALHGMLSDVQYPLLSGTNVPRDFVEYPSQFNEMWARDPGVLARCARHYQSGEPLPASLLSQLLAAQNFNQGYQITEYLKAAQLDQAWHALAVGEGPAAGEVMGFEAAALARSGLPGTQIPPRYHSPYFLHVFADDYPASYYAYLWSEVLARDTGGWFQERGGLSRANGERLRATILSRGWSCDTQVMFRELYGASPDIAPLLKYRGLTLS